MTGSAPWRIKQTAPSAVRVNRGSRGLSRIRPCGTRVPALSAIAASFKSPHRKRLGRHSQAAPQLQRPSDKERTRQMSRYAWTKLNFQGRETDAIVAFSTVCTESPRQRKNVSPSPPEGYTFEFYEKVKKEIPDKKERRTVIMQRPRTVACTIVALFCLCQGTRAQGRVSAWGFNYNGQLGNGTCTTIPRY